MKALKVIGIVFGSLFLVCFIFWMALLKAPSTNAMCKHVNEIMKNENPDAPQMTKEECAKQFAKGTREGARPYAVKTRCLMAAKNFEELSKCGKR